MKKDKFQLFLEQSKFQNKVLDQAILNAVKIDTIQKNGNSILL